jgi:hypothetical protein
MLVLVVRIATDRVGISPHVFRRNEPTVTEVVVGINKEIRLIHAQLL